MCYPGEKQIKFCCLLPCTGSKTSVKFIAADSHKTTFSLYACASSIFFDCYSVMSDSVESLLRKTGVEFEVPGFDDSGSVSRNGVVNNSICWLCTVVQNGDSRIDPNQQIVSPKTRETTNYTVGFLHTHQQVNKSCCVLLLIEIQMNTKNSAVCYWSMKFPPPNPLPLLVFC